MEIINTSAFEKLKIRSVDVKQLKNNSTDKIIKIKARDISIVDLKSGFFVKTCEPYGYLYMILDKETERKINTFFDVSYYNDLILVQPFDSRVSRVNFDFMSLCKYSETWPNHINTEMYDITDVYITGFDTSLINSNNDFLLYFDKYRKKIKKYENNKHICI